MDLVHLPDNFDWDRQILKQRYMELNETEKRISCFKDALLGTPRTHLSSAERPTIINFMKKNFGVTHDMTLRPNGRLRLMCYFKPVGYGMRGTLSNPSVMNTTFVKWIKSGYQGQQIEVSWVKSWFNRPPNEQVRLLQQSDYYISDGGTLSVMALFLSPGSSAFRLPKCIGHCPCPASDYVMDEWFSEDELKILFLRYNATKKECMPANGMNYHDISISQSKFEAYVVIGLDYVIKNKPISRTN
eukprot:NODE_6012_length_938_cov_64.952147_g5424_i0.p1 GENE.NODE_6012_length_938_cov_64.952147_g5424_i0~~NODE_6012_length_938_cov_64.952147_g5424_i0.p1  ORF type:complete len:277 (+),score=52.39 NODE_6012_length_938_cov_64.952147_g5424_i0:100-831(+)